MTWLRNLGIRNKLFMAFGTQTIMLVVLLVYAGVHLYETDQRYNELIVSSFERQANISSAIKHMSKIRDIDMIKGYRMTIGTEESEMAALFEQHAEQTDKFVGSLHRLRHFIKISKNLSASEKSSRFEVLENIEDTFFKEYLRHVEKLDYVLYRDKQETYRVIGDLLRTGDKVVFELETLYEMVYSAIIARSEETTVESRLAITWETAIGLLIILCAVLASTVVSRAIQAPMAEVIGAMSEISKGNLLYPIRSNYHDEFGLLANQIGDMVDNIAEMNKALTVMDHLDSMVIVTDFDYNLIYANKSAVDTYGVSLDDYRGKKCYKVLGNCDKPCDFCLLTKTLSDTDSSPSNNFEFVHNERLNKWVGGKVAVIKWVDGSKVYFQSLHDETEKKKNQVRLHHAMEAAEAANAAKSQFLANMSHEIRTPMNAVLGMAELLLHEDLNKRQLRYAEDMKGAAMALLQIINDILDVSRIQAGKMNLVPVHYDFNLLIDNIGSIVQFLVKSKKMEGADIIFKLTMPETQHLCLYGDDVRLRQVLLNLLGNAVKFTAEGYVQLIVEVTETTVRMTVRDTGLGIPSDEIQKIFDTFEQIDVLKHRSTKGTGLGLAITKSLVAMMNGNITVESIYGQGSTFLVEIPKILGDEALIQYSSGVGSTICAPDAKILVVDDNEMNLHVASGLLSVCEIKAETAKSAQQAIEMIGQNSYDLVFMDYRMPEMTGTEATEILREQGVTIPIIALTASAVVDAKEKMLASGMSDYLSKPIVKMELMNILLTWLPADKIVKQVHGTVVADDLDNDKHKEFWAAIERIKGLNLAIGLERVDGKRDFYEKVLQLLIREIGKSDRNLPAFLSAGDLENFQTEVHGIKGVLANVGAMELSEKAYILEKASKAKDVNSCEATLPLLLEELKVLRGRLQEAFAIISQADAPMGALPAELPLIFEKLMSAFEEIDLVLIDQEIEKLNALPLSGRLKEEIEQIKDAVMMMEYDRATEHIRQLLGGE